MKLDLSKPTYPRTMKLNEPATADPEMENETVENETEGNGEIDVFLSSLSPEQLQEVCDKAQEMLSQSDESVDESPEGVPSRSKVLSMDMMK